MGTIYTLKFQDRSETELDQFLTDPTVTSHRLFNAFRAHLGYMADTVGFSRDLFKFKNYPTPLGYVSFKDSTLRLYSYWASDSVVIFGDGGIKPRNAPTIAYCSSDVQDAYYRMVYAGKQIDKRHANGYITFVEGQIKGNLSFSKGR